VLVVTEPTLSGIHDMERVIELTQHFGTRTLVCVNKFDLNEDMTESIGRRSAELSAEVIGRVPYDVDVTKAQLQGKSVVEYSDGKVAREIEKMWETLKQILCAPTSH